MTMRRYCDYCDVEMRESERLLTRSFYFSKIYANVSVTMNYRVAPDRPDICFVCVQRAWNEGATL